MYVVRLASDGVTYKNAKPCSECTKFLKKFFPGKIIYISETGCSFEKVSNLESDHLSFYQRKLFGLSTTESPNASSSSSDDD